jgi:hypothetical protein
MPLVDLTGDPRLMRRIALLGRAPRSSAVYSWSEATIMNSATFIERTKLSYTKFDEEEKQNRISAARDSLKTQLDSYLSVRLATSCLALCQKMQQRLPRELRDLVYERILEDRMLLVDHKTINELEEYQKAIKRGYVRRPYFPGQKSSKISLLIETYYIGTETAQELAESHYRNKTFCFDSDTAKVSGRLETFLFGSMAPWLSFGNVSDAIRKIELHSTDARLDDNFRVLEDLGVLMRMTHKIQINIELERRKYVLTTEFSRLVQVVSKIFPLLQWLRLKGHSISMEIQNSIPQILCPRTHRWIKRKGKSQVRLNGANLTLSMLEQLLQATK